MNEWVLLYMKNVPFGVLYARIARITGEVERDDAFDSFLYTHALEASDCTVVSVDCYASKLPWPLAVRREDNTLYFCNGYTDLIDSEISACVVKVKKK
jgi:hypothetical protein